MIEKQIFPPTDIMFRVLDCIECRGPRVFLRDGFPCIRHTSHYFVTTLLYSTLLGFLGNKGFLGFLWFLDSKYKGGLGGGVESTQYLPLNVSAENLKIVWQIRYSGPKWSARVFFKIVKSCKKKWTKIVKKL